MKITMERFINIFKYMVVAVFAFCLFASNRLYADAALSDENGGQTEIETVAKYTVTKYDSDKGTDFDYYRFESEKGVRVFIFYLADYSFHNSVQNSDTTGRYYIYVSPYLSDDRSECKYYLNENLELTSSATRQLVFGKSYYLFYSFYVDANTHYSNGRTLINKINIPYMTVKSEDEAMQIMAEFYNDNEDVYQPEVNVDWDSAVKNNTFGLNNFSATYLNDTLMVTWNGVSSRRVDLSGYKNTYVKAEAVFKNGEEESVYQIGVYGFNDNGFMLDISKHLPGSDWYLYAVRCVPYYYAGDDTSGKLYEGVVSSKNWDYAGNVVNPDDYVDSSITSRGIYDEDLGTIQNLKIDNLTSYDCHNVADNFTGCFSLSWDVPSNNSSKYNDYYEVKFNISYNYLNYWGTSLLFDSALVSWSDSGEILCVNASSGAHSFCAHDFADLTGTSNLFAFPDSLNKFNITRITKIYIRRVKQDKVSDTLYYGDWAVFSVDKNGNIFKGSINSNVIESEEIFDGRSDVDSEGNIDSDLKDVIKPDNDSGFSFAGIDLTDITSIASYFIGLFQTLFNIVGSFPSLFASIFSFLPFEIITMIYVFFVVSVISGLLKIFT